MPGNPLSDPNWASDVADTIERLVGNVRDKATLKVVTLVRALVFGLLIAVVGLAVVVLVLIVSVRLLQALVRFPTRADHASAVWISYLVMSALLFAGGAFAMRKRSTSTTDSK